MHYISQKRVQGAPRLCSLLLLQVAVLLPRAASLDCPCRMWAALPAVVSRPSLQSFPPRPGGGCTPSVHRPWAPETGLGNQLMFLHQNPFPNAAAAKPTSSEDSSLPPALPGADGCGRVCLDRGRGRATAFLGWCRLGPDPAGGRRESEQVCRQLGCSLMSGQTSDGGTNLSGRVAARFALPGPPCVSPPRGHSLRAGS